MKWNWQLSVALFFLVSLFGAILLLGKFSSPLSQKGDRELASLQQNENEKTQQIKKQRHQNDPSVVKESLVKQRSKSWFKQYFEDSTTVELKSREFQLASKLKAGYQEVLDHDQFDVVKKDNGMIYYLSEESSDFEGDKAMPVLYDANRDVLGVVTGKLMVKLVDEKDFDLLQMSYGLEHYYFAQTIGVHYFIIPKGSDPFEVYEEVRNLRFVEKAQLEVIEEIVQIK